jgi:hypothetical protein
VLRSQPSLRGPIEASQPGDRTFTLREDVGPRRRQRPDCGAFVYGLRVAAHTIEIITLHGWLSSANFLVGDNQRRNSRFELRQVVSRGILFKLFETKEITGWTRSFA